MDRTGIVHTSSSQPTWLPLEKVDVRVLIVDVNCRVTLIQTYNNPLDTVTGRCKYMFPVPASAAVCSFRMETSDGRIVKGVAKDKEVAQREYETALQARQFAGLVNYATDDIFTISIGSIPAHAGVKIYLDYVMNLANDDNADEIRFQLSSGVGQRYGTPPDEVTSALRPNEKKIKITCEVQMAGRIQGISSPSHDISETRYTTSEGRPSRRRTTIKYRSNSFLDRDFVLIISAKDLDAPRCFAELHSDGSQTTLALQMSLVPHFPPIATQEYLFVVDRSASMGAESPRSRIAIAKDTLILMLRMLPARGTMFNVYIFDGSVESWSPHSLEYNARNLREASAYVDSIGTRGGTELGNAIQQVLQARNRTIPTAIFLLTDGEVYEDGTIPAVRQAVAQAPRTAPLRVFTLGIGNQVSTATCEGIATAGNGVYLYATQAESIIGKCARLFRAGRTPILRDVTIDWGIPDERLRKQSVTFSGQTLSPRTLAISPPAIQQAPTQITNVHSGTRTIVFAIIQLRERIVPQNVRFHGRFDNDDSPFQAVPIRVDIVHLDSATRGLPMIHTLTAWRLIQEHEGRRVQLPSTIMPASEDETRRAVIVSLGERYQLVSRYTSFIAIDSGQDDRRRSHRQAAPRDGPRQPSPDAAPMHVHKNLIGFMGTALHFLYGFFRQGRNQPIIAARTLPGSWSTSSPPDNDETEDDSGAESDASTETHETFSTLSTLDSCDCSNDSVPSSPELRPQLSPEEEEIQRQPSPRIEPRLGTGQAPLQRAQSATKPVSPAVIELVRLQDFDGSYSLVSLQKITGIGSAVDEANNLQVDDEVWATALAIAFMRKKMVDQKDLLNDLATKAREYLAKKTEVDLEELLRTAAEALPA